MERIGRESQQIAREQIARPDMTRWERPDKPRHHNISTNQNEDVGMEPHGARQDNDVEERQLCQMELWREIPWDVLHDPGATRDAARQRSEERWQGSRGNVAAVSEAGSRNDEALLLAFLFSDRILFATAGTKRGGST